MKPKKFTPGPWVMKYHGNGVVEVLDGDDLPIVNWVGFDDSTKTLETRKANALLIAAAPDLLEILKTVLRQLERLRNCNNHAPWQLIEEVSAAIAKAEGGQ